MVAEYEDEVRVQRHRNSPECDVIVTYRGREMSLRCRDYDQVLIGVGSLRRYAR